FTQLAYSPRSHAVQSRSIPRTTQWSAGSTTTRSPTRTPVTALPISVTRPTASCPNVNGNEMRGEKNGLFSVVILARSLPQMPLRLVATRAQRELGSRGSWTSCMRIMPNGPVTSDGNQRPSVLTIVQLGTLLTY